MEGEGEGEGRGRGAAGDSCSSSRTIPDFPLGEMTLRVGLSLVLGGVIGANRQLHRKPAGLRTMMLVCVGSILARC